MPALQNLFLIEQCLETDFQLHMSVKISPYHHIDAGTYLGFLLQVECIDLV